MATKHGVAAGVHCGTTATARQMIDRGFQLVTLLSDNRLMAAAAKQAVSEIRGAGR